MWAELFAADWKDSVSTIGLWDWRIMRRLAWRHLRTGYPSIPKSRNWRIGLNQGFLWTFLKKLELEKTQYSSEFSWKLKQNFRKTQKPATQIELLQYKSSIFIPIMCCRLNVTVNYIHLWPSNTPYFQDSLEIKQRFENLYLNYEKLKINFEKTQAKSQKNSKTANSSWVDLSKKCPKKALGNA